MADPGPSNLPEYVQGLSDTDQLIYHYRFVEHLSLRACALALGCSHEQIRLRVKAIVPMLRHEDHEQLRDEEGLRLDELRSTAGKVLTLAIGTQNPELALKAIRELHALTRTAITLYGLELQPGDAPPSDDKINDLLNAYQAGVTATLNDRS